MGRNLREVTHTSPFHSEDTEDQAVREPGIVFVIIKKGALGKAGKAIGGGKGVGTLPPTHTHKGCTARQ